MNQFRSCRVIAALLLVVALLVVPSIASACNGGAFFGGNQFGNSAFVNSQFVSPFAFSSFQQTQPVFVNQSLGFNSFGIHPAAFNFGHFNRFNNFNRFNSFNGFNNQFVNFNNGFNNFNGNFAFGRFGAVRPAAVNFNGRAGVRGPLGFFHPFNNNGRATLLPRFR